MVILCHLVGNYFTNILVLLLCSYRLSKYTLYINTRNTLPIRYLMFIDKINKIFASTIKNLNGNTERPQCIYLSLFVVVMIWLSDSVIGKVGHSPKTITKT